MKFPYISHINDVLPAVKDRKDFVVLGRDWGTAIDYVIETEDTFDDPLRLECRGIKFDKEGNIIARPFHKFFNIGQKEQLGDIDFNQPHIIMDKLDGSMVHGALVNNEVVLMTRKGITDTAQEAMDIFFYEGNPYEQYIKRSCGRNYTPIFEYTGPSNRIVIKYEEPELRLLAERSFNTGDYWPNLSSLSILGGVPFLKRVHSKGIHNPPHHGKIDAVDTIKEIEETKEDKEKEGIVIQFDNGHMLKVKADDYVRKHRVLSDLQSKKKVVELVLNDGVDDVLPILNKEDRERLLDFRDKIVDQCFSTLEKVIQREMDCEGLTRKEIALKKLDDFNSHEKAAYFKYLDTGPVNATEVIKKALQRDPDLVEAEWDY